jgi:hypothetical protein
MPIPENITEKIMSSSRSPRMVFVGNSLLLQSRWGVYSWFSSRLSLHSPRFSGNQYAPSFVEKRKRFMEEKPCREYLSDEFETDFFSAGILMVYFWFRCRIEYILRSDNWISLFDRRSTVYHILSNVLAKTILWMLFCCRRALWTLNCYLASGVLP